MSFQIRPRFETETEFTRSDLLERFKQGLKDQAAKLKHENSELIEGRVGQSYLVLFPCIKDRHYWSPQLTITLEEAEEGRLLVRGLYGPSASVWTLFVFIYGIIALLFLVITIIGFANISLGISANILWWLIVLALMFSTLYITSYFGQKKSSHQKERLHYFVEKVLDKKFDE